MTFGTCERLDERTSFRLALVALGMAIGGAIRGPFYGAIPALFIVVGCLVAMHLLMKRIFSGRQRSAAWRLVPGMFTCFVAITFIVVALRPPSFEAVWTEYVGTEMSDISDRRVFHLWRRDPIFGLRFYH